MFLDALCDRLLNPTWLHVFVHFISGRVFKHPKHPASYGLGCHVRDCNQCWSEYLLISTMFFTCRLWWKQSHANTHR